MNENKILFFSFLRTTISNFIKINDDYFSYCTNNSTKKDLLDRINRSVIMMLVKLLTSGIKENEPQKIHVQPFSKIMECFLKKFSLFGDISF